MTLAQQNFSLLLSFCKAGNLTRDTEACMRFNEVLATRIDEISFSTRVQNALRSMSIDRVGDLIQLTEPYLLHSPNIGRKSLTEIRDALAEFGLTLGMVIPAQSRPERPTPEVRSKSVDAWIAESAARRLPFLVQASRNGYASADVHLGRLHLEGLGVAQDYRKARLYFIRAARRGNRLGYWNLALIYRVGYGVRRSQLKAARWQSAYERRYAGAAGRRHDVPRDSGGRDTSELSCF